MTAAVILAAGASTRLGRPKQLLMFEGERLLERAVRIAREAECAPLVVVLGAEAGHIEQDCTLTGTVIVVNAHWREGMGSSLRLGVSAVQGAESAIVMTCDMPSVTSVHLRALVSTGELTASRYSEHNGVPAFFPAAAFSSLLNAAGDTGARELLRDAPAIALAHGELDIDTPEDVRRLLEISGTGRERLSTGSRFPREE